MARDAAFVRGFAAVLFIERRRGPAHDVGGLGGGAARRRAVAAGRRRRDRGWRRHWRDDGDHHHAISPRFNRTAAGANVCVHLHELPNSYSMFPINNHIKDVSWRYCCRYNAFLTLLALDNTPRGLASIQLLEIGLLDRRAAALQEVDDGLARPTI